jgi:hypothetical protein
MLGIEVKHALSVRDNHLDLASVADDSLIGGHRIDGVRV